MYFNPYSIPNFFTATLTLILGLIVYKRNIRSFAGFSFFIFSVGLFIWLTSYGIVYSAKDERTILFFSRMGHAAVVGASPFYYLFCASFLKRKIEKIFITVIFVLSFLFIWFLFNSNLYFTAVTKRYWGCYPTAGFLASCDFIMHIAVILRCIELYISSYYAHKKINDYAMCNRIKYMGLAFSLMLIATMDYIPKYCNNFYPFGYLGVLGLIIITSIAIIKHNLLDINIVVQRSLVYSLLATIITIIYFVSVFFGEKIFSGFIGYKSIPLTIIAIAIFIIIFQPLKNKVQSFVAKVFFRKTQEDIMKENEKLLAELRHTEKMKAVGTLAAGLAHEIKNPLTAIKTFTEFLDEKYGDQEFRAKFKRIVGGEVERINSIVQQLLDFAKPKPLSKINVNINEILENILTLLSNDFIKKRVTVVKKMSSIAPIINADLNQMKQAFLNIMLNSVEAMRPGGVLNISTTFESGRVFITISDNGIGISKKDIPYIFDPFYSKKESGSGLGLSIVHNIIKEHGGRISVESEIGKGTSFEIML